MDTTRPAPVLVDDLIPIILESEDHWWPRDFQRLALVSPAWVSPVRKRLYAHPSLRSYRACHLLARTFTENPELLSFVRSLELRPSADEDRTLDEREMQSLRRILGLKGLRSVTLGGDLAVAAQRFLGVMVDTRAVTELHIDGCMLSKGRSTSLAPVVPSLEWDDAIAFRFPNLRSLTLSNVLLTIIPSMMDRPSGLTHLTLNNVDLDVGFLPDICQGSWETLRDLRVVGGNAVELDDGIRSMLEMCENIETLHYEAPDLCSHASVFDDEPPPCPSLRRLYLSGFDANPQTLQAIIQACPQLEDLAVLGRVVRISPEQWASFVTSGALPSLRRLVAPSGTNQPPFTFWSSSERKELYDACHAKGVELASLTAKGYTHPVVV
ncbi:hypothetical protein ONZ51_g11806 [Trametes cubensis]|uniref:F-box protein n=1 Tax=Trametes cubensis TaxID=1111947 RepID=A0AAD7X5Z8_9APHY|nr:hypothetical protein ONZ51_g11806 [Trametes cubensis]